MREKKEKTQEDEKKEQETLVGAEFRQMLNWTLAFRHKHPH